MLILFRNASTSEGVHIVDETGPIGKKAADAGFGIPDERIGETHGENMKIEKSGRIHNYDMSFFQVLAKEGRAYGYRNKS